MTFGERVREVRERRGISQQEVADRAKVSRQLIYYLECGQRDSTSVDIAKRIALALGVSIDYLAGTWDDPKAAPRGTSHKPTPSMGGDAAPRGGSHKQRP